MKRTAILFLFIMLIGCVAPAVQTSAMQTGEPVVVIVEQTLGATAAPQRSTPEPTATETPVPAPEAVVTALPAVEVRDGTPFGADIVCFADGFGYAYDIEGWTAAECRLFVEPAATSDLPPYESHRLLLEVGGETFCLAELRYDTEHLDRRNTFGQNYEWVIWDSDLVELSPSAVVLPAGKDIFDSAAFLESFDAAAHTLSLFTAKNLATGPDEPLAVDFDSISDRTTTLTVAEDAALALLNENGETVLVTRDRLFALLESGYPGLLPAPDEDEFVGCLIGYDGGTLRYLVEAY